MGKDFYFKEIYEKERAELTQLEIDAILDSGKKWQLASSLKSKGSVIFPHTYLKNCGHHIAAAVHACLDSGADQVVALGVLHSLDRRLKDARRCEREGVPIPKELRGIFDFAGDVSGILHNEFSLASFEFLLLHEARRRGIRPPKVLLRYVFLVNLQPESLPGIAVLRAAVCDSVVVATSDLCHHGVAYGHTNPIDISPEAYRYAKGAIQAGLDLMIGNDYRKHYEHCLRVSSDGFDTCPVLNYLLGPLKGTILDLTLVDTAALYAKNPTPSWVAATLVALEAC